MYLFLDTETTGLLDFGADIAAPHQPRIAQIAAILTDEDGLDMQTYLTLIKPDGWDIPQEATAIHGICTSKADKFGVPIKTALQQVNLMASFAQYTVCHNISYDMGMIKREDAAIGEGDSAVRGLQRVCTMHGTTKIVAIQGSRGLKWPKLSELFYFLFGTQMVNAHDAMSDARAMKDCFFELKRRGMLERLIAR